jgi:hypothetical protein
MKKIIFFCALMLWNFPASGETLAGGYPVCVSKELHEQFMTAYMAENKREYQHLLKNGCFLLPEGMKITILEQSLLTAIAKVRVFAGNETLVMWTHVKNIRKKNGD